MNTQFDSLANGLDPHVLKQPDRNSGYLSTDTPFLNSVELLENTLGKNIPGITPVKQLNAESYTPSAVANRILGFVEHSINQGATSGLEAQSMIQQAREGIAQGFAEARDILNAMPQMTDNINSQINETESLIFQGLDGLESTPVEQTGQQQAMQIISQSASFASQFKQSSQASIEIFTQDGDKIEVSYSAFSQTISKQNYSQNQQGVSASFAFSETSSTAFQFNVQGELDADEQLAINELLSNVGDLANQFFRGDVQSAFRSAMELGFDSEELKSFAVDFQQSTYIEVVQNYQRTEQLDNPDASSSGPGPAIGVLHQLEQLIEQAKENAVIEQPENTVKSLLAGMLDLMNQDVKLPVQNYIKEMLENE